MNYWCLRYGLHACRIDDRWQLAMEWLRLANTALNIARGKAQVHAAFARRLLQLPTIHFQVY
jgi:hypothetical protein